MVFAVDSNKWVSTTQTCSRITWSTVAQSVVPHCCSPGLSHEGNQGGPGERQRGSGCAEGGNGEAELQPEPDPHQHPAHAQRPGLPRRGVGRHLRPAVPQHPPVAVSAAHQRQLHQGEGATQHTVFTYTCRCLPTPAGLTFLLWHQSIKWFNKVKIKKDLVLGNPTVCTFVVLKPLVCYATVLPVCSQW